jgi:hypothetical protein
VPNTRTTNTYENGRTFTSLGLVPTYLDAAPSCTDTHRRDFVFLSTVRLEKVFFSPTATPVRHPPLSAPRSNLWISRCSLLQVLLSTSRESLLHRFEGLELLSGRGRAYKLRVRAVKLSAITLPESRLEYLLHFMYSLINLSTCCKSRGLRASFNVGQVGPRGLCCLT